MRTQKEIEEIYNAGKSAAQEYKTMREWIDWGFDEIPAWWTPEDYEVAKAGFISAEIPTIVNGWRWGNIPQRGFSFNYADNQREMGVSVMEVYGGEATQDNLSALFLSRGRNKVEVIGWLNTVSKGSDGEPLLMWAEVIKQWRTQ